MSMSGNDKFKDKLTNKSNAMVTNSQGSIGQHIAVYVFVFHLIDSFSYLDVRHSNIEEKR